MAVWALALAVTALSVAAFSIVDGRRSGGRFWGASTWWVAGLIGYDLLLVVPPFVVGLAIQLELDLPWLSAFVGPSSAAGIRLLWSSRGDPARRAFILKRTEELGRARFNIWVATYLIPVLAQLDRESVLLVAKVSIQSAIRSGRPKARSRPPWTEVKVAFSDISLSALVQLVLDYGCADELIELAKRAESVQSPTPGVVDYLEVQSVRPALEREVS